jgi:hypothetical protein
MRHRNRADSYLTLVAACIALSAPCSGVADAQKPANQVPGTPLIDDMVGTWSVEQRMWPAAGADPKVLPPALATRTVKPGGFLQEVMEPERKLDQESFQRIAYFNYNTVSKQFEYFSLDSRMPQMMNERSNAIDSASTRINLEGGTFVAPQWGNATNVAFTYRLVIGSIERDRQIVQLYLTPKSGKDRQEFLAFEYVYTRH